MKKCKGCKKKFKPNRKYQKYCTVECTRKAARKRNYIFGNYDNLNSGQVGAMSELYVCADLIKRGFDVFRSVSPACFCDLIAIKNDKVFKIEVKTGSIVKKDGKLAAMPHIKYIDRIDLIAIVIKKKVRYFDSSKNKVRLDSR